MVVNSLACEYIHRSLIEGVSLCTVKTGAPQDAGAKLDLRTKH